MENNIFEIAGLLNELMQKQTENSSVKYFYTDGMWWYMTEDEDVFESSEESILEEVKAQWADFVAKVTNYGENPEALRKLIDDFTDYEETPMERLMKSKMTSKQLAESYEEYIDAEFYNDLQKLQVMTQC